MSWIKITTTAGLCIYFVTTTKATHFSDLFQMRINNRAWTESRLKLTVSLTLCLTWGHAVNVGNSCEVSADLTALLHPNCNWSWLKPTGPFSPYIPSAIGVSCDLWPDFICQADEECLDWKASFIIRLDHLRFPAHGVNPAGFSHYCCSWYLTHTPCDLIWGLGHTHTHTPVCTLALHQSDVISFHSRTNFSAKLS